MRKKKPCVWRVLTLYACNTALTSVKERIFDMQGKCQGHTLKRRVRDLVRSILGENGGNKQKLEIAAMSGVITVIKKG